MFTAELNPRHQKQPLLLLKELSDKQRLEYELSIIAEDGGHFQYNCKIFSKSKDGRKIQLDAKGFPKQTKRKAKHSAAEKALEMLGKGQLPKYHVWILISYNIIVKVLIQGL